MEFLLFNVRFALKKDFFTFDSLKLTLAMWWAFMWRSSLVIVILSLIFGFAAYFVAQNLGFFQAALIIATALPLLVYISARLQYYALFEKEYKTVARALAGEVFAFLSWAYWKRILLTFAVSFVVGFIVNLLLQILFPVNLIQNLFIALVLNFLLWSAFLFGGTWNFIPAKKVSPDTPNGQTTL